MKSYMTVDRIEGKFAVCELEFISTDQSQDTDYWERDTEMVDIPVAMLDDPKEGDVFIVDHEKETLYRVYGRDNYEKQRRLRTLKQIMG